MDGRTKPRSRGAIRRTVMGDGPSVGVEPQTWKEQLSARWKASNSQGLTKYNKTQRDVVQRETWIGASICLL